MLDKHNTKKQVKIEKINSFCIAAFLCSRLIVQSLPTMIQFDNILVVFLSLIFLTALVNNRFRFSKSVLLVIGIVSMIFCLSYLSNGIDEPNKLYLLYFFVFGGLGLYLSDKKFDINKVYKYIIIISIANLPFVLFKDFYSDPNTWMGISYSILPTIFAVSIYMTKLNNRFIFKIVILITAIIYIGKVITYFTRGAVLACFIFAIVFLIITMFKSRLIKAGLLILITFSGWYLFKNIESILIWAQNTLLKYGFNNIRFIEKSLHLIYQENLSNGRDIFYSLALNGIQRSPIFGNGIGSFEADTGLIYVHNLFLQLGYEGGILLIIPVALLILYGLHLIVFNKKATHDLKLFVLFLYSVGIFRLMFSSVYWGEQTFWFILGFLIVLIRKKAESNSLNTVSKSDIKHNLNYKGVSNYGKSIGNSPYI